MVTRRFAGGYAPIDGAGSANLGSYGTATSSFGTPAGAFGTGSFSPAASASMPLSSVGSDAFGRIRSPVHNHSHRTAAMTGPGSPVAASSSLPTAAWQATTSAGPALDGRVGGITSRTVMSSRESLAAPGRPQSLSFGTSTSELSGNKTPTNITPTNMRTAAAAGIPGGSVAELSGNAYMGSNSVAGSYGSHATPPRMQPVSYPASSLLSGGGSTAQLTKKRAIHDGPGAPEISEGARVEALVRGRWVRATVLSVDAEDTRQGMGKAGKPWMVHCDHEADGVCSFADHVKLLTSASYMGKREFEVGDRVQALLESRWFLGVVAAVPEHDKDQMGRWTVQRDGDPEGFFSYSVHVRAAAGAPPPPPPQASSAVGSLEASLPFSRVAQATAEAKFVEGDRVEAYYKGTWHVGTVLRIPKDDEKKSGRWTIQCDADPQGTLTYARQVRTIGDLTVQGIDRVKADVQTAPLASKVFVRPQENFKEGDRVEGLYEGDWFEGTIVRTPKDDKDGFGRWTLQCDDDAEGIRTYCKEVRNVQGGLKATGEKSSQGSSLRAKVSTVPTQPVTGNNSAATEKEEKEHDVPEVVISQGMAKNGEKFIVVTDLQGTKLETFRQTHIEFEVSADTKSLNHWLETLTTEVLPGLLMIIGQEVNARGATLKQLEQEREGLRGMEDYKFFGLSEEASDKDVEKAYKKMSAKLHPDKGGDSSAFADMKKRFDELKEMRQDGTSKSKGDGEIKWDSKSRTSMMTAHGDLHMQLVWITKQCQTLESEIEALRAKQRIHFSLTNGEDSNSQPAVIATGAPSFSNIMEEMQFEDRENTFLPDVDPLLGSEETLDPEEMPTIKLEPDTLQQALAEQAAAANEASLQSAMQRGQIAQPVDTMARPVSVSPWSADEPMQPQLPGQARVLGGGIQGGSGRAPASPIVASQIASASTPPKQMGSSLLTTGPTSSAARGITPATGRVQSPQPAAAQIAAGGSLLGRPLHAAAHTSAAGLTSYGQAAASMTSYGHRVVGNGVVSGAPRHAGDVSPRFSSTMRSSGTASANIMMTR